MIILSSPKTKLNLLVYIFKKSVVFELWSETKVDFCDKFLLPDFDDI